MEDLGLRPKAKFRDLPARKKWGIPIILVILGALIPLIFTWAGVENILHPPKTTQQVAYMGTNGTSEFHSDTIINNPQENWKFVVEPYYDVKQNNKNDVGVKFSIRCETGMSGLFESMGKIFGWLRPKKILEQKVTNTTK